MKLIVIDIAKRTITYRDQDKNSDSVELNRSEINMLVALVSTPTEIIPKGRLVEIGWPDRIVGENSLAVSIMKLRKKLDTLAPKIEIMNYPGEGYRLLKPDNIAFKITDESDKEIDIEEENEQWEAQATDIQSEEEAAQSKFIRLLSVVSRNQKLLIELALVIGFSLLTFFFLYREAFDCFTCLESSTKS
ncbi:winged helix-turn-helix transcriptional regulator [Vibrio vulnificus]